MKIEIMIAVLGIICIGSLAAAFVLWAKIDEQKQKTADEHANYLAAINIGKANAEYAQRLDAEIEELREFLSPFEKRGDFWYQTAEKMTLERDALQDRLSALLCPMNDHVWKDGRCVKCGRAKDD